MVIIVWGGELRYRVNTEPLTQVFTKARHHTYHTDNLIIYPCDTNCKFSNN